MMDFRQQISGGLVNKTKKGASSQAERLRGFVDELSSSGSFGCASRDEIATGSAQDDTSSYVANFREAKRLEPN